MAYDYDKEENMYDLMNSINEKCAGNYKLHSVVVNPRSITAEEEFIAIYEAV